MNLPSLCFVLAAFTTLLSHAGSKSPNLCQAYLTTYDWLKETLKETPPCDSYPMACDVINFMEDPIKNLQSQQTKSREYLEKKIAQLFAAVIGSSEGLPHYHSISENFASVKNGCRLNKKDVKQGCEQLRKLNKGHRSLKQNKKDVKQGCEQLRKLNRGHRSLKQNQLGDVHKVCEQLLKVWETHHCLKQKIKSGVCSENCKETCACFEKVECFLKQNLIKLGRFCHLRG